VWPIVGHLPRNSITATLEKTRDAVSAEAGLRAAKIANRGQSNANSVTPDAAEINRRGLETRKMPVTRSFGLHGQN
ncbi:MAG TPA: hypothetical protein VGI34_01485, partial [Candidatus Acidoferrales bacterium]